MGASLRSFAHSSERSRRWSRCFWAQRLTALELCKPAAPACCASEVSGLPQIGGSPRGSRAERAALCAAAAVDWRSVAQGETLNLSLELDLSNQLGSLAVTVGSENGETIRIVVCQRRVAEVRLEPASLSVAAGTTAVARLRGTALRKGDPRLELNVPHGLRCDVRRESGATTMHVTADDSSAAGEIVMRWNGSRIVLPAIRLAGGP